MAPIKRWVGRFLLGMAVLLVARALWDAWPSVKGWRPSGLDALALGAASLGYGLALLLLARAWSSLLAVVDGQAPRSGTARAWTSTQLAKYLPGNVMHLAGRHLALRALGYGDRTLALAATAEVVVLLVGAGVVLGFVAACWLAPIALVPLALALLAGHILLLRVLGRQRAVRMTGAIGLSIGFFVAFALVALVVLTVLTEARPLPVMTGGVASWAVGFVTPGAPAGLGAREASFLWFLRGEASAGDLVLAATLVRIVTTLGDGIAFALGLLLPKARLAPGTQVSPSTQAGEGGARHGTPGYAR